MLLYPVIALALALGQASAATDVSWAPCPLTTLPVEGLGGIRAECTTYAAPLCHPGICETPDSANSTIGVFVRRVPAMARQPELAPNVRLVQGGPFYSSNLLDIAIIRLYAQLNREVNVYTMDYRGTGHNTPLKCAAQAKSSTVTDLDPELVPECAKELEKYGDLAAFSTTSAAMDLTTFISKYGNDFGTTVYGVGFGSMWVERVMHLNPPEVTGYVLDGVVTASVDNFYMSALDATYGEVADAFMDLCSEDSSCSARFKKKGLRASVQHLMTKLDKSPNSTCAKLVKTVQTHLGEGPPSFALRLLLGGLLSMQNMRALIPPIVFRLLRCAKKDVAVLTKLIENIGQDLNPTAESAALSSFLLGHLIVFSEMRETPSPTAQELKTRYEDVSMSGSVAYTRVDKYCAFSKEKSQTCNKLKVGNYKGNGIIYKRDEYCNKAAKIPEQASVLLMSGGLGPLAPTKNAQALLKALDGDKKELVTFKYSTDISIVDGSFEATCGMDVLASFVQHDGDLSKLNKACVEDEAALNWTIPDFFQYSMLSTQDAYDGDRA